MQRVEYTSLRILSTETLTKAIIHTPPRACDYIILSGSVITGFGIILLQWGVLTLKIKIVPIL